jgi:hypothetical protein
MSDNNKKPKSFDTTTRLNVNDTFDDDEITLVEELPPIEDTQEINEVFEEESVTEKLSIEEEDTEKEVSVVSKQLKNIETKLKTTSKEDTIPYKIVSFFKLIALITLQFFGKFINWVAGLRLNRKINLRQKLSFKNKTVIWTIIGIVCGLLLIATVSIMIKKFPSWTGKSGPKGKHSISKGVNNVQPLRLSPAKFLNLRGEKVNPKAIKKGSTFEMFFYAVKWNTSPKDNLKLNADIRIYAHSGKLVLYQPGFATLSSKTDRFKERIEVKTRIKLSKNLGLGYYRVLITVTEASTQRKANVQTRIRIIK